MLCHASCLDEIADVHVFGSSSSQVRPAGAACKEDDLEPNKLSNTGSPSSTTKDGVGNEEEESLSLVSYKLIDTDLESQVIKQVLLDDKGSKADHHHEYECERPVPMQRDEICALPLWMMVCIILLSIAGIVGAIFELRYQFQ